MGQAKTDHPDVIRYLPLNYQVGQLINSTSTNLLLYDVSVCTGGLLKILSTSCYPEMNKQLMKFYIKGKTKIKTS